MDVEADGQVVFGDLDFGLRRWNGSVASDVTASTVVGGDVGAVAVDRAANRLYVGADYASTSYWQEGVATGTWGTGDVHPGAFASGTLYAFGLFSPSVFTFSPADLASSHLLMVDNSPWLVPGDMVYGLTVDTTPGATPTVYVSNDQGQIYAAQDGAATHTLIATGLGSLRGLALDAAGSKLYAASWDHRRVVAIDLASTSTITEVPIYPALQPGGRPKT
ncbi:MAG: hypothetical protein VKQ33_01805 [Candidatus Sericytochromatia bacterium]|nr:hypothetical protein [Candidatus Sericytochromatia bacterium]